MTRFKVFYGDPADVENRLNEWAAALAPGTRIRRTQLAAADTGGEIPAPTLFALVNYDDGPGEGRP